MSFGIQADLDSIYLKEVIFLNPQKKKYAAPIIVTVLMVLYYVVYFGFLITLVSGIWKFLFGVFPFVLSAVMIKVCMERIEEIKKGEENDLSQY